MNQVMCVGRLVSDPEVKELENGKRVSNITLAIARSYKNEEGVYESDFVDFTVWDNMAGNISEYCKKGDIIGVKSRIETKIIEDENGNKTKKTNLIADKISFLSSAKAKNDDMDME